MITIPLVDQNSFVIEASLGDMTYFLRFDWNSEAQMWTMAIQNARNEALLHGVSLVPNTPLLEQFRHLDVPAGEFIVYCGEDKARVGRDDFVTGRCQLLYLSEEEYAAIRS